jgi:hypothetical protein
MTFFELSSRPVFCLGMIFAEDRSHFSGMLQTGNRERASLYPAGENESARASAQASR